MFWKRKLYPYDVRLHLNGRHPYLKSKHLDYPTREVTVRVEARSWKHADKVALETKPARLKAWSWWTVAIARAF